MVTLKQIAEEAGVSVMTVSNVINKKYSKVSPETVARVKEIIERRKYIPNLSARSLSSKNSHIIAVLISDRMVSNDTNILDDPYYHVMIGNIEKQLRKSGYYIMLHSYGSASDVISLMYKWNIDGAIMFYPFISSEEMGKILSTGIPTVVIDRHYPEFDPLTVDLDDFFGGYIAARYLIRNGHRKIGMMCPYQDHQQKSYSGVVEARINGVRKALEESGLILPEKWLFSEGYDSDYDFEAGKKIGQDICRMEDRPTAIVSTLFTLSVGLMEGVYLSGKIVPGDLSVIGFDEWPVLNYIHPKLTTVSQDFGMKAQYITDLLLKSIRQEEIDKRHITLTVNLCERQSVARLANL